MVQTTASLPDRRAPSMPDTPYSAYCRVCWYPVYVMWIDGDHEGRCMFGHSAATDCPDAMARAETTKQMHDLRAAGLIQ